jgi:HEAT repeat protein
MRFFCPGCWKDFAEDLERCPLCGLDIRAFFASRDYVEKLIVGLSHPHQTTQIRAASLLGKIGDERAVQPLIALVERTHDVYIAHAAIAALGMIRHPTGQEFLAKLLTHPVQIIREAAAAALSNLDAQHLS